MLLFCQKIEEARGGPPWAPTTWWRGQTVGRAATWCGGPGPPLSAPLCVLHPSETLRPEESSRKYSAASTRRKNTRERKALRQGEICRENSFPEGGNCRHPHRHRAGLHRDHHHLHRHHHHPHRSTPFRCNI